MNTDAQEKLDMVKQVHQVARERNQFSKSPAFGELDVNNQLAHLLVTKSLLDVLTQEVDNLCDQVGIPRTAGDTEERLAQVIQLFDGAHRQKGTRT